MGSKLRLTSGSFTSLEKGPGQVLKEGKKSSGQFYPALGLPFPLSSSTKGSLAGLWEAVKMKL